MKGINKCKVNTELLTCVESNSGFGTFRQIKACVRRQAQYIEHLLPAEPAVVCYGQLDACMFLF